MRWASTVSAGQILPLPRLRRVALLRTGTLSTTSRLRSTRLHLCSDSPGRHVGGTKHRSARRSTASAVALRLSWPLCLEPCVTTTYLVMALEPRHARQLHSRRHAVPRCSAVAAHCHQTAACMVSLAFTLTVPVCCSSVNRTERSSMPWGAQRRRRQDVRRRVHGAFSRAFSRAFSAVLFSGPLSGLISVLLSVRERRTQKSAGPVGLKSAGLVGAEAKQRLPFKSPVGAEAAQRLPLYASFRKNAVRNVRNTLERMFGLAIARSATVRTPRFGRESRSDVVSASRGSMHSNGDGALLKGILQAVAQVACTPMETVPFSRVSCKPSLRLHAWYHEQSPREGAKET